MPESAVLRGYVFSLYRMVAGLLLACHGAASLFGILGGAGGGGKSISPFVWPGGYAALIQLIGGGLVLIGLATRPAAVLCSGSMAYAYFSVHMEKALFPIQNGGELAALFSWAYLMIAFVGAGPISLDAVLNRLRGKADGSETAGTRAPGEIFA